MPNNALTYESIRAAHHRIADGLRPTPCAFSAPLSERAGMMIWAKHDYLQATGSFKERGARNALLNLSPAQQRRGVIAASAGNHALGLARHGGLLGIPVTVVMPTTAPRVKIARCRELGARVMVTGENFDAAALAARLIAQHERLTTVHPFDDLTVAAGQGTLALELFFAQPQLDAILVPVGGGGLLAGVATVTKALSPQTLVIGVEPVHAASYAAARAAGRPVDTACHPSWADGLAVKRTGRQSFANSRHLVDRIITVTEAAIAEALLTAHETHGMTLEGAGATALAACLAGALPELRGKRVGLALTGANIDPATHTRALHTASAARTEAAQLCA